MKINILESKESLGLEVEAVGRLIADTQRADGDIPWSAGDKTDPWDLVESAMGLNIAGYREQARQAFGWLARRQLEDGSWYSSYRDGQPEDMTHDTNMASYIAVGVFHDYLIHGDKKFLENMWPTVSAAIDFVVGFQASGGQIYWASSPEGVVDRMALLTGSSSVFMCLKCALALAGILGVDRPDWREARDRLGYAIRYRRHLFNMSKTRFSMDWFYPVLSGALKGVEARMRIEKYWEKYVVQGHGVLCVSDQPWITMAETSELVLALAAMGNATQARIVFNWIQDKKFDDGSYWCGYTHPDMVIWPEEKITWTNAVVLMAADILYDLTPAAKLFSHRFWEAAQV